MHKGQHNPTKLDNNITSAYYDIGQPGAYLGPAKLHRVNPKLGSIKSIREQLQRQDDYSLQRQVNRKFKRARVIVSEPNEQYDCDLADMSSISKYNDNYRYLLIAIDVF